MAMIAPSILSADFMHLGDAISMLNKSEADFIHLDIMDGLFVPNITIGFPVIKQIRTIAVKPLDVHLMIVKPERYIQTFADSGSDIITVHYEACTHLHRTVQQIKQCGKKAGVSINPHTPVKVLEYIVSEVDMVLIMSVNPGFAAQHFIPFSIDKVKELYSLRQQKNASFLIEVDGGVSIENALSLYKAGADVLVAGNSIFSDANPAQMITQLKAMKQ